MRNEILNMMFGFFYYWVFWVHIDSASKYGGFLIDIDDKTINFGQLWEGSGKGDIKGD